MIEYLEKIKKEVRMMWWRGRAGPRQVLVRWPKGKPEKVPPGKRVWPFGGEVEAFSTVSHDLDFVVRATMKTGEEVSITGTLTIRIPPDKVVEAAQNLPEPMPSYPSKRLEDWFLKRLKGIIRQAVAEKNSVEELSFPKFWKSLADEFQRKLRGAVEAEITLQPLVGKPVERPEDLEKVRGALQEALGALQEVRRAL